MAFEYSEGMEIAKDMDDAQKQDRCRPRFFMDVEDVRLPLTDANGAPVMKNIMAQIGGAQRIETVQEVGPMQRVDVEKVEIEIPGESKLKPVHTVTDEHRRRWPRQYADFKAGMDQRLDGTAIEQWPALTRGQCERFRMAGIRTIEDIAHLPDAGIAVMGPDGFKLRAAAQRRIQPEDVRERETKAKFAEQEREIAALKAMVNQMTAQPPVPGAIPAGPAPQLDTEEEAAMQKPIVRKPPQGRGRATQDAA